MNENDRYTDPPKRLMSVPVALAIMAAIFAMPVAAILFAWLR